MTSRPFTLGVQAAAASAAGREAIVAAAQRAESAGFDEFYTFDHFGSVDPFLPLLIASEATTDLRVGPLVLNAGFYNPGLLARTAATLDQLTSGRLVLGLGAGWAKAEHDTLGIDFPTGRRRVEILSETLAVVAPLLRPGAADLDGGDAARSDTLGVELPRDRIPLLLGGSGDRMLELAGRYADIFQFTGLAHLPDGTPRQSGYHRSALVDRIARLQHHAGQRAQQIELSIIITELHVGTPLEAVAGPVAERTGLGPQEVQDSPFVFAGGVEEVAAKVRRIRAELGISHFVVTDAEAFAPVVELLRRD
ncbi:MAG: TIGR03621 family F420-dependent LLM class oxidoreductase [Acidimicrobiia bacterium]|nr:TIGR03621 family F420-dependent LLM class oxidoreductase [Acidimicrobiia bacterium]MYC44492.1 TIGR03621 family F420-dependent LLM class oxidoreductase [Acidimicrobiia bacterium]MYI19019.1 TIGR03621 family F420-dependent LLM class oxidoreductase [Acidimicrobiia bacterium]